MNRFLQQLGEWRRRLWYRLNRGRHDAMLRDEMAAHAERLGHPARFGNQLRLREESHDVWGWARVDALLRDVRLAIRTWRRTPGVAIAATLSLGLGFALAASTLAVANAYLIRALPLPEANRLYHVIYAPAGQPEPRGMTALDWSRLADVVEVADASAPARYVTTGAEITREFIGLLVAPQSIDAIGIRAVAGRALDAADYRADADAVAMISHAYWHERFGGGLDAIGATVRVMTSTVAGPPQTFRIVGVLPPGYRYIRAYERGPVDLAIALREPMRSYMLRLRAGVRPDLAAQRITAEVRAVATTLPPNWPGVQLESVHARYVAGVKPAILAITVAAALLLLIVCANVAVLLLLRALKRQKEVAVRLALGAGRAHIARTLVIETSILCAAALVLGLGATALALRVLAPVVETQLGRAAPGGVTSVALDAGVLLVIGALAAGVAALLSLMPLVAPWQRRLADALRRDLRTGTDGPSMRRLRSSLIAVEIAGSLALLAGCGLMVRSVVHLLRADLGFTAAHVQRGRIALPAGPYADPAAITRFYDDFLPQFTARFGADAALTNFIPFYPAPAQPIETDAGTGTGMEVGVLAVTEAYFTTLEIPLLQGRAFSSADRFGDDAVAIVSETLARRLWPDQPAIGRRLRTAEAAVPRSPLTAWRTVVGVARDVRQTHADNDLNDVYLPLRQAVNRYTPIFVRTDASTWITDVQKMTAAIDPQILVVQSSTLQHEGDVLLAAPTFLMSLLSGFAAFAVLLATIGLYGVTAYGVQQRGREVAIRMALGATSARMIRMFLREGGLVLGAGVAAGLAGALAVAGLLQNQLHGVSRHDALTLAASSAAIVAAATLAIWLPARRAASAPAVDALRSE